VDTRESPSKTIERELDELRELVRQLEANKDDLEASLQIYERGVDLSASIRKRIAEAETRVEMLNKKGRPAE
jgi:exodeoxyribonuclease VII small subunit